MLSISIAVLDPFPVGMHIQLLDAIDSNLPIVTAPMLQECTARHGYGLLKAYGRGHVTMEEYPGSIEEYAVYALSLQQNLALKSLYIKEESKPLTDPHSPEIRQKKEKERIERLNNILNQRKKNNRIQTDAETIENKYKKEQNRASDIQSNENDLVKTSLGHGEEVLRFIERLMKSTLL